MTSFWKPVNFGPGDLPGSNKGRFNGGKGIEGLVVAPHEVVAYDGAELLKGIDTQIRRAEELLRNGFPKGVVPYAPPR